MAGQPQIPRAKLDRGAELRRQGRTWPEAADEAGVSVATLKRFMAAGKGGKPAPQASAATAPSAQPAPAAAPPPRRPPPAPASGEPRGQLDLLRTMLEELLVEVQQARDENRRGDYLRLAKETRALSVQIHKLEPAAAPTREELEALAKPKADEVAAKVRSGVIAVAQREAETGKCLRCGQVLPRDLVVRRRAEAGMPDPAADQDPAPAPVS